MKSRFVFFVALMSSFGCSLAVGAPDRQSTEQAGGPAARAGEVQKLPLDHGPRAATTPWLNEQRRAAQAAAKPERSSGSVDLSKNR